MDTKKSLMVRMYEADKDYFDALAKEKGESVTKVIHALAEEHRKKSFFQNLREQVSASKADSEQWLAEQEERRLWESTLADGLESDG